MAGERNGPRPRPGRRASRRPWLCPPGRSRGNAFHAAEELWPPWGPACVPAPPTLVVARRTGPAATTAGDGEAALAADDDAGEPEEAGVGATGAAPAGRSGAAAGRETPARRCEPAEAAARATATWVPATSGAAPARTAFAVR